MSEVNTSTELLKDSIGASTGISMPFMSRSGNSMTTSNKEIDQQDDISSTDNIKDVDVDVDDEGEHRHADLSMNMNIPTTPGELKFSPDTATEESQSQTAVQYGPNPLTRSQCKKSGKLKYLKYLFDENKYRLDIVNNRRFYLAAQVITRVGFFSKFLLYATLGIISIAAAVDTKRQPLGPASAFAELEEMFSGGVIFLLIIGLWCYGANGIFFVVFDIDQLGRKTAGAILKRFGRVFSSGFYFVLGVEAARVLGHVKKDKSGSEQILTWLYSSLVGKIVVCVLGCLFFVVSIVYLVYIVKPDKFKKELSTERMTKGMYFTALGFARIGAIGRSMFFAAFGACLIQAVAKINKGEEGDPSLLGFEGVFRAIAKFNSTLLFIIASLVVVYSFWCLWLMFFRRLPAHHDPKYAQEVVGTEIDPNLRFHGIILNIPKKTVVDEENDAGNLDEDQGNIELTSRTPSPTSTAAGVRQQQTQQDALPQATITS
ncbi:hypothetical protein SAMD00019534_005590 [Acytostelium subglobosum LB1]|uniref:hypothetical protein n=1 Tax=Acytostelium subglobosum LB1 TaxID=1410327 RepID=UPI000644B7C2|nr:hypothetical protein SAMD00019534_005590 [Acytostelium subglobosum LB1]GAM17384.1 hypothetical protein SAMD00019534_005590 [Acytostelium subglobosum LB1]|eukprot:XP_012759446.1 hypothetical protein SAMD00019534_005590 [Acytostelium subglobosum LB1]